MLAKRPEGFLYREFAIIAEQNPSGLASFAATKNPKSHHRPQGFTKEPSLNTVYRLLNTTPPHLPMKTDHKTQQKPP
jgi:hypothetical protein